MNNNYLTHDTRLDMHIMKNEEGRTQGEKRYRNTLIEYHNMPYINKTK